MFEFHGWAVVQYHTYANDSTLQNRCWQQLIDHIATIPKDLIQLQRYNGCDSLVVVGQHNHRSEYVIDLFHWVAANTPGSYGLLYVRDDEDPRESDYRNCFRVWRLCRGQLTECDDPFLSPAIPTIEDPYDQFHIG